MDKLPLISVIVPVYNVQEYVEACVDSIICQSYANLEIILVDDGSTDQSGEICEILRLKDPRIKVLHQTNRGPSVARNAGIDIMVGKYVAFVDSDDIIHQNTITLLYRNLVDNSADISAISLISFSDVNKLSTISETHPTIKIYEPGVIATESMLYQEGLIDNSPCGKLFKSSLFEHCRFPKGLLYEDLATIPYVCLGAKKVVATTMPMYFYRKRESSILGSFTLQRYDVLDVVDDLVRYMQKHYPSLIVAAQSRKFSANMNILYLMLGNGIKNEDVIARCWRNIKELRVLMIFNPRVRIKNKMGALLSYIGLDLLLLLFAKLKIRKNR